MKTGTGAIGNMIDLKSSDQSEISESLNYDKKKRQKLRKIWQKFKKNTLYEN